MTELQALQSIAESLQRVVALLIVIAAVLAFRDWK